MTSRRAKRCGLISAKLGASARQSPDALHLSTRTAIGGAL
jgi:hypothetical protein